MSETYLLENGARSTSESRFERIFHMQPLERIEQITAGVAAQEVMRLARAMGRSKERVAQMLGLALTTIDRKAQKGELLNPEQSERVVATAKLIGQVEVMIEESGEPEGFNAAAWFADWLDTPLPALAGRKPVQLMSTAEGRELLGRLLATAQSSAYV